MRTRPLPRSFGSGELAPWLDGMQLATNQQLTKEGCRTLENFIVRKQGSAVRRPGTFFVDEVKDSTKKTLLVPVSVDDDNHYVLEIGDAYIRFYKNHARILTASSAIYEIVAPWSTADLSDLRWCYVPSDKALLFANFSGNYPVQELQWISDANWVLSLDNLVATDRVIAQNIRGVTQHTEDLSTWTQDSAGQVIGPTGVVNSIASGKNCIVAAGSNSSGYGTIFRTEDGISWTMAVLSAFNGFSNIAGNTLGEFVAIGASGTIAYSYDDGITWSAGTSTQPTSWQGIDFDPSTHIWRISSPLGYNAYSHDGSTWVSIASPGTVVAIANNGAGTWVGTSQSGIVYASSYSSAWTLVLGSTSAAEFSSPHSVAYGTPSGLPLWVAVKGTNGWLYNSSNGITWTFIGTITDISNSYVGSLKWVHSKFLLASTFSVGSNDSYVWESYDGATFSKVASSHIALNSYKWTGFAFIETVDSEWFDSSDHYPKSLAYHEGRLVLGPTRTDPSSIWGSDTANLSKFDLGDTSEKAFNYDLQAETNVDIQWFMGNLGGIVIGTRTAEGILIGSQEEGVTPLTAQFRWLSTFGSSSVQPVRVNDTIVFVQRGGEVVRGYIPKAQAYESPDLTMYADHITAGGVVSLHHQDDPQTMVYAIRTDGQLLALTNNGQITAWSRIKAAPTAAGTGVIESVAIIPSSGPEDEIWQIVNRNVAGATKRYIEYYATQKVPSFAGAHYVDCGIESTSMVPFGTLSGLSHLAGEVVDVLVDGTTWLSAMTVSPTGTLTLGVSGTDIHAGLAYTSTLQTMRGSVYHPFMVYDDSGLNKRTAELLAWVADSSAIAGFGPTQAQATEQISYSSSTTLVTDICVINFPGEFDRDDYIWCVVSDPRPFTLVSILAETQARDPIQ
jgi:hypothetical protein